LRCVAAVVCNLPTAIWRLRAGCVGNRRLTRLRQRRQVSWRTKRLSVWYGNDLRVTIARWSPASSVKIRGPDLDANLTRRALLGTAGTGTILNVPGTRQSLGSGQPDHRGAPALVDSGLSPERVARFDAALRRQVEPGKLLGLVALVHHQGREHLAAIGTMAFDSDVPMARNTIFRLASMTKPVTAVAALTPG
jgi:hypothetical protein